MHDFSLLEHDPARKVYRGLHTGRTYDYSCERSQRQAVVYGHVKERHYRDSMAPAPAIGLGVLGQASLGR